MVSIVDNLIPLDVQAVEAAALRPQQRLDMLTFARQKFTLSKKFSNIHGLWSDEYTPYFREPMQWLSNPPVELFVEACTQGGKSTLELITLAWVADQYRMPTLFCLPQKGDTERRVRTRIRPMFADNRYLLDKVGGDVTRLLIGGESDLGDMTLYLAWSTSPQTMADNPVCVIELDEQALFEFQSSESAVDDQSKVSPVDQLRDRQRTYRAHGKSILLSVSSPEVVGDIFDKECRSGSDHRWHVPCLHCGRWHKISSKNLLLDKTESGLFLSKDEYENGDHARYVCPHCKNGWSELERANSNDAGKWVSKHQTMDPNGTVTGDAPATIKKSIRINTMMLHPSLNKIGATAAKFAEAMVEKARGNKRPLRRFVNREDGKPWRQERKVIGTEAVREKQNDFPQGVVPNDVKILVAGADFHKSETGQIRVDYLVKGFADDLRSYDILFGHAASLDAMLRETTTRTFPWAEPCERAELVVVRGFVDSGYQPDDLEHGVFDEVYQFCRQYWRTLGKIWYPIRGQYKQVELFRERPLDKVVEQRDKKYKRRTARMYKGMVLINLAVTQVKDKLADWITSPMDAPASVSFANDLPPEFFEQMVNEYRGQNDKGKWGWWTKNDGDETHAWDVETYAAAAGLHAGVERLWSEEELTKMKAAAEERRAALPMQANRRRTGTIQRF